MEILFRDDYLTIVSKPAGVLSEPSPAGNDVFSILGGTHFPVHRLDAGTGGAMLVAGTKDSAARLSALISAGGLHKTYLAVLDGVPPEESGRLEDLLYHDARRNKSYVVDRERRGVKKAVLNYKTLRVYNSENVRKALIEVTLETGRTHQIRVQFAHTGCPLTGDKRYGSRDSGCGFALWCNSLSFRHPYTGEAISVSSPPPDTYPWTLFDTV